MANIHLPTSVLNLGPIREGETKADAIQDMVELAQATEKMGYLRYWIAEHHNTPTLVSSSTAVLIKHVLEQTETIRVGSGGIMLPNHSPLVVAEQFGTMATIYPDRVDLGLGRAPGTDMATAIALRRSQSFDAVHAFPKDIQALLTYFGPEEVQGHVKANIAIDTNVPIYVLGSSLNSAHLAAELGLPYFFASHFAPDEMAAAIRIYKQRFKASPYLDEPYMGVCLNVVADETDEAAQLEFTSTLQFFLNVVRGTSNPLMPPIPYEKIQWNMHERKGAEHMASMAFVGSKDTVKQQLIDFQTAHEVNEIMAVSYIFDKEKQKRSFEIFKDITTK